jgi:hypothetical protein
MQLLPLAPAPASLRCRRSLAQRRPRPGWARSGLVGAAAATPVAAAHSRCFSPCFNFFPAMVLAPASSTPQSGALFFFPCPCARADSACRSSTAPRRSLLGLRRLSSLATPWPHRWLPSVPAISCRGILSVLGQRIRAPSSVSRVDLPARCSPARSGRGHRRVVEPRPPLLDSQAGSLIHVLLAVDFPRLWPRHSLLGSLSSIFSPRQLLTCSTPRSRARRRLVMRCSSLRAHYVVARQVDSASWCSPNVRWNV